MSDLLTIAKAWVDSYNPTPIQKQIAEQRIQICNKCEYNKYVSLFNTYLCGLCNCPINKKIFVNSKTECQKNKWPN